MKKSNSLFGFGVIATLVGTTSLVVGIIPWEENDNINEDINDASDKVFFLLIGFAIDLVGIMVALEASDRIKLLESKRPNMNMGRLNISPAINMNQLNNNPYLGMTLSLNF
jgi:hypothetical protein